MRDVYTNEDYEEAKKKYRVLVKYGQVKTSYDSFPKKSDEVKGNRLNDLENLLAPVPVSASAYASAPVSAPDSVPVVTSNNDENAELIDDEKVYDGQKPDGYQDRFIMYIPSQIITLYIFLIGVVNQYDVELSQYGGKLSWLWMVYILCQISVPIYLHLSNVKRWDVIAISTLSFLMWASALQGPFEQIDGFSKFHINVMLPVGSYLLATYKPKGIIKDKKKS